MEYEPFPHTRWTLIRQVGQTDPAAQRAALTTLLTRYQPALRSYLRVVKRLTQHETDDLLQAFITEQVLERELVQKADASRGRFRTFLLTSLNNFTVSRGRQQRLRATDKLPETPTPDASPSPDAVVEAAWARALVHEVIAAMRQECENTRRQDIWLVFQGRILAGVYGTSPVISYEQLAAQLQLKSPTQAANLLVTAKRMYARLLREAVGEYEEDADAIDAEIAELRHALAADSSDSWAPDPSDPPPPAAKEPS
jgi:DNA-directed RNA polymerase specialized sigma24 family protein